MMIPSPPGGQTAQIIERREFNQRPAVALGQLGRAPGSGRVPNEFTHFLSCALNCVFIGKTARQALSQRFSKELKKYHRWIKKWIKAEVGPWRGKQGFVAARVRLQEVGDQSPACSSVSIVCETNLSRVRLMSDGSSRARSNPSQLSDCAFCFDSYS